MTFQEGLVNNSYYVNVLGHYLISVPFLFNHPSHLEILKGYSYSPRWHLMTLKRLITHSFVNYSL